MVKNQWSFPRVVFVLGLSRTKVLKGGSIVTAQFSIPVLEELPVQIQWFGWAVRAVLTLRGILVFLLPGQDLWIFRASR